MNLKKIIAAVAASAVAVSAMAFSAFAITDYPDGYYLDLIAEGYTATDVYGFTINISGDIDSGVGGGAGFNSASTGWESHEWGNNDAGKEIASSNGEITLVKDAPVFVESDITDPDNPYAQIWVQQWWGSDVTITGYTLYGADGAVIASVSYEAAAAEEEAPAEDEAAAEEEAPAEEAEDDAVVAEEVVEEDVEEDVVVEDDSADEVVDDVAVEDTAVATDSTTVPAATGNASAAVILSVMAVAGAAAVVAKKRK